MSRGADQNNERARLEALMAAMADGQADALFELLELHRAPIERQVRGILASLHRVDLVRSDDDVASMAVSAAFVLFARAAGWRPDGALPWVWAYRSIREEIVAQVGHPSVELDPTRFERPPETQVALSERVVDVRDLARRHGDVAAWIDAVEDVANQRDSNVHLEYQVQKRLGDPSPANTVASMFKLSPANVRQIDRRVRQRLEDHAFAACPAATQLL